MLHVCVVGDTSVATKVKVTLSLAVVMGAPGSSVQESEVLGGVESTVKTKVSGSVSPTTRTCNQTTTWHALGCAHPPPPHARTCS